MKKTVDFLDAVKATQGIESDYALSPILGLSRAQLSRYRSGNDFMGDLVAMKVAELLKVDPAYVIACLAAERAEAKGQSALAAVWMGLARKYKAAEKQITTYGKAAAVAFLGAILALFIGGGPDGAAMASPMKTGAAAPSYLSGSCNSLCIM